MTISELYLATLTTGARIVVSIKSEDYQHLSIGDKKRQIVDDLNKKLGTDIVIGVKYYGLANITLKDQFARHKEYGKIVEMYLSTINSEIFIKNGYKGDTLPVYEKGRVRHKISYACAMRWLRQVHHLNIDVDRVDDRHCNKDNYTWYVDDGMMGDAPTHEDACLDAIKYCMSIICK